MRWCFRRLLEEIQAVWLGHVYVCLDPQLPEELKRAQSRPLGWVSGRAEQAGWHRRCKHKTTTDRSVRISWPWPPSCLFQFESLQKPVKLFVNVCSYIDTHCFLKSCVQEQGLWIRGKRDSLLLFVGVCHVCTHSDILLCNNNDRADCYYIVQRYRKKQEIVSNEITSPTPQALD